MIKGSNQSFSLDNMLQEYVEVSEKIESHKAVICVYEGIADSPAAATVVANRKNELFIELEHMAEVSTILINEFHDKVKALETLNTSLVEDKASISLDFERLKLEYQRQIGVLPKAMNVAKTKDNDKHNEDNNTDKPLSPGTSSRSRRGAPKGHRGNTRPIPDSIDNYKDVLPPQECSCGCCSIIENGQADIKYIEDILPVCRNVTMVKYLQGICSDCGGVVRHNDGVNGPPVSIGSNLAAHLTMLRQMGITYRKLSHFCTETLNIPLTPSGVLGIVSRCAEILRPTNNEIAAALKEQDVLNADETGWPVGNKNGYIWGFFNSAVAYFHSDTSRSAMVPKAILGEDFDGTVVCDFYGSYNFFKNIQRCWIHWLRDIDKERKIMPGSITLQAFETKAWELLEKGIEISRQEDSEEKSSKVAEFKKQLLALSKIKLPDGKPKRLTKRIEKYHDELCRFLTEPNVEYHNNRAERHLRPTVVARKNSYGSNTELGAQRHCIINTVIETCRLNGIKPIKWLKQALLQDGALPSPFAQE